MKSISNKIDLVVSFDTTGSMYPVLSQVRTEVEKFVHTMFSEFSDLRLGIIAHGDYCDKDDPYTIRVMDLTRDKNKLCKFVKETQKTYGGDTDECYELVLNTARTVINWRDEAQRVLVLIGDASPHGVRYPQNTEHLDWEEEAKKLGKDDVKIFSVHALSYYRSSSKGFYKSIAELSGGVYLTLDQFNEIVELIKATCYQQGGEEKLNEYISIIRDNGKLTNSMDRNFRRLKGEKVEETEYSYGRIITRKRTSRKTSDESVTIKEMAELEPVMPGRFQVMTVDENCDIKGFVTKNGIEFKKGRGFYELTKVETVQQYKEIIMQDKETGEMFVGSQVREKLGLQPQTEKGGVNEKLYAKDAKEFTIFVQSTSVNRKLIAGTTFLYEISDIEDTGTEIKETPVVTEKDTRDELTEHTLSDADALDKLAKAVLTTYTKNKNNKKKSTKATGKKVKTTKKEPKPVESKSKATKKEVDEYKFSDVIAKGITKPAVDESKKVIKQDTKSKFNDKALKAFTTSSARVLDGAERFAKSQNKKNTEYLVNNLKKSIETAQKMLDSIQ